MTSDIDSHLSSTAQDLTLGNTMFHGSGGSNHSHNSVFNFDSLAAGLVPLSSDSLDSVSFESNTLEAAAPSPMASELAPVTTTDPNLDYSLAVPRAAALPTDTPLMCHISGAEGYSANGDVADSGLIEQRKRCDHSSAHDDAAAAEPLIAPNDDAQAAWPGCHCMQGTMASNASFLDAFAAPYLAEEEWLPLAGLY